MILQRGEIVLIRMRYHQASGGKIRPALAVLDTGDVDFVAAPVTSQERHSEFDFAIADWQAAGLNVPSWARLHKLAVITKADILRTLGSATPGDQSRLAAVLCRAFCSREG
jgi:mRNA-degrading endonuclease toxin of MazEF toxin-antitoxin module